jgi:hypothetical protein
MSTRAQKTRDAKYDAFGRQARNNSSHHLWGMTLSARPSAPPSSAMSLPTDQSFESITMCAAVGIVRQKMETLKGVAIGRMA